MTEDDSNDEKSGTEVDSCVYGSRTRKDGILETESVYAFARIVRRILNVSRQRAAATSVLRCDPRDEDGHRCLLPRTNPKICIKHNRRSNRQIHRPTETSRFTKSVAGLAVFNPDPVT